LGAISAHSNRGFFVSVLLVSEGDMLTPQTPTRKVM